MKANTSTKIRLIASALDLCNFAACVNAGDDCAPIGDGTNKFNGTFDGDGHIIHNLRIESFGFWSEVSLFRDVGEGGTIKKLNLPNVKISGHNNICGLAYFNYGKIRNVHLSKVNISGRKSVAGLVGSNHGTIRNCTVSGNISGNEEVGGLVGFNGGTIQVCSTAGTVTGKKYVGGLVGNNEGSISNCTANATVNGNERVGGLFGFVGRSSWIQNCTVNAIVSGKKRFGGLAGNSYDMIRDCRINVTLLKLSD